jgi:tripartite-type tricarboxylate transporter receptor subunit TctC
MTMKKVPGMASLALCAALFGVGATAVIAQTYPDRPIRLIVAYPAGGGLDIVARLLANALTRNVGWQFVIDNRSGAGGLVGTDMGAKAPPDGYTLVLGTNSTHGSFVALYPKLPYDAIKDFAPVTDLVTVTQILVVHPSLPVKNVKELIALAKSRPGELNYGSGGSGVPGHLAMELIKTIAGIRIEHVPYKGIAPALTDLLGGQVQVLITNTPPVMPYIESGRLRALAVVNPKRAALLPELPTMAEAGLRGQLPDFWWGLFAPAGTPRPIIARLNTEIRKVLEMKDVKERFFDLGVEPDWRTPEDFAAFVKAGVQQWAKAVKDSGARAD